MSKIIGPINLSDWKTMSLLLQSKKWYKDNNRTGKFNSAMESEDKIYAEFKKIYKIGEAA